MRRALVFAFLTVLTAEHRASASDGKQAEAESYLYDGKLAEGEQALARALKTDPKDDEARFALGAIQFVRAIEARMQAFHRYGFGVLPQVGSNFGITNLPIPLNRNPEPLDNAKARRALRAWLEDLAKVEKTLAGVTSPDVKLRLTLNRIKLDFDGDGKFADDETLLGIYHRFNPAADPGAGRAFTVTFDRGDVDWLRGYTHLLSALSEAVLAHDISAPLEMFGYLAFRGMKPPHSFMIPKPPGPGQSAVYDMIFDAVGLIHMIRLPVIEPERMRRALTHLEAVTALSRSSWAAIRAETDDDHEWIPNPKQDTVVPNGRVQPEMIAAWFTFLDEFDAILAGKKLVPFWRGGDPNRGINVRKIFTEPSTFDLVMWVQGAAAAPYLENGDVTSRDVWQRLNRIFRGEFVGFAFWFN